MRITLAQLEAFFWVARLGSVSGAARQLNLAQPSVSLRLRDLETALSVSLFSRVGRGLRLTHEGDALLSHAQTVIGEIDKVHERIGKRGEVSGVVRVGVPETFALVCLPSLLRVLRKDYPLLRLELSVSTSSELEAALHDHRLDLAFTINPAGDPGLRLVPLGIQETSWVAPTSWNVTRTVRPTDLRHMPIITNPYPSAMYRQIIDWFRTGGIEPVHLDMCTSVNVIAQLVVAGVAVGFLPLKMIADDLTAGSVQILNSRPRVGDARLYAAYRATDLGAAVDAVIRTTQRVLSEVDFVRL